MIEPYLYILERGITLLSPLFGTPEDGVRGSNKAMRQAEPEGTNGAECPALKWAAKTGMESGGKGAEEGNIE